MFERLILELSKRDTPVICQYYDTIGKIKESYAKMRQLYPSVKEAQRLYDDTSKVEKILQDMITERFLSYKDEKGQE